MDESYRMYEFRMQFPTDGECLDIIRKIKYPKGIHCTRCRKITIHYKLQNRPAYTCKNCRTQTYPLTGTLFTKSSTPLHLWFYAMFLMTQTRGNLSAKQLERELRVTYKTAWRMQQRIHKLMKQNNADLLSEPVKVQKWTFFNTLEFTIVQRKDQAKD